MQYHLAGRLEYSPHGHDNNKFETIDEYIEAGNLENAILIAKAMLQSHKTRYEVKNMHVVSLNADLQQSSLPVWRSKLVPAKTKTEIVVVAPEHFEETFVSEKERERILDQGV